MNLLNELASQAWKIGMKPKLNNNEIEDWMMHPANEWIAASGKQQKNN